MGTLSSLVSVLTDPSTITLATFGMVVTAGGMRLWYLIERRFDSMQSSFTALRSEVDEVRCGITDITDKLAKKRTRLDSIDETLFYVLDGLVESGVNGRVKKYRDRCASAGRWKD